METYEWLKEGGLIAALFIALAALGKRLFVPIAALQEMKDIYITHYKEMKDEKDRQIAEKSADIERWRTDYRKLEDDLRRSLRIAEQAVEKRS